MPNGTQQEHAEERPRRDAADAARRACACRRSRSWLDVADVVDHQHRAGDEAGDDRRRTRPPEVDGAGQHERRAGRRDEPEEDEDEDLAQAVVAVRPLAAGVEPGGDDRGGADERAATSAA